MGSLTWPTWPDGWLRRHRAPTGSARWVVLDVETTGLDARRDSLLAIAAVALRPAGARLHVRPGDSFEATLRATLPAAAGAAPTADARANILLHGIGLQAQREGGDPAQVLHALGRWAAGAPLLGFHVGFDQQVISRAERLHLPASDRVCSTARWIDIEPLAALCASSSPGQPAPSKAADAHALRSVRTVNTGHNRSLDGWLDHYGIVCTQRHLAAADALATAELLMRLWPCLHRHGARHADDLFNWARSRRWLAG